ncbi:STAS/SEC14 domain-containing protein [Sandaracinus amylolyticus]|uniref:STAS/SEC14 domain-containing protein n=1 Tax=Sandaracinus amylolyticus TaxID=927083 RepID=A0A0F6WAS9_9BACT|nr:STAS/SEC14 domain-containing protein [Sandaracinus amylolyticus]AKF11786.1 hypothetical protein DB32_008935 [Sandaracinus amylolyticus]
MASIRFDDSQFPLVVTEWPDGEITDAELEQWIAKCTAGWPRGRQITLHLGMRATGLTSLQRKRMSEFAKTNERMLAKVIVATAIVADSPVVRGIITAINWLAPPPYAQRVFARRGEAETWLREQLAADRAA